MTVTVPRWVLRAILWGGTLGVVASLIGFTPTDWKFWAVAFVALIARITDDIFPDLP